MSTVAAVEAIAPEFVGDARVQPFIDNAMILHDSEYWGVSFSQAIAFYVAHCLTTLPATAASPAGLTGGAITSIKTGGMSVGYSNPSTASLSEVDLLTTVYGRKYIWIRDNRVSASPLFVKI